MRILTLAFILPLLFLFLCACGGSAHGLTMNDIAEREEQKLVKQHMVNYPKSGFYDHRLYKSSISIHDKPTYIETGKNYADNKELIFKNVSAEERAFMRKVANLDKSMEHYEGR